MSKNNYLQTHFFPPQTYLCITLHPLNPHRSPPYSLSQLYVLPQKSYHGTAQHAPPSARPLALQWFVVEGNLNITLSARQTLRLSHPSSFEPSQPTLVLTLSPNCASRQKKLIHIAVPPRKHQHQQDHLHCSGSTWTGPCAHSPDCARGGSWGGVGRPANQHQTPTQSLSATALLGRRCCDAL